MVRRPSVLQHRRAPPANSVAERVSSSANCSPAAQATLRIHRVTLNRSFHLKRADTWALARSSTWSRLCCGPCGPSTYNEQPGKALPHPTEYRPDILGRRSCGLCPPEYRTMRGSRIAAQPSRYVTAASASWQSPSRSGQFSRLFRFRLLYCIPLRPHRAPAGILFGLVR